MRLCDRLSNIRLLNKLNKAEAARMLGVKDCVYNSWENGISLPGTNSIINICTTFGISADFLLGINPEKKNIQKEKKGLGSHSKVDIKSLEESYIRNGYRFDKAAKEIGISTANCCYLLQNMGRKRTFSFQKNCSGTIRFTSKQLDKAGITPDNKEVVTFFYDDKIIITPLGEKNENI